MTKYREIIRLTGLGFSQRNIMASCGVAQKTVVEYSCAGVPLFRRNGVLPQLSVSFTLRIH